MGPLRLKRTLLEEKRWLNLASGVVVPGITMVEADEMEVARIRTYMDSVESNEQGEGNPDGFFVHRLGFILQQLRVEVILFQKKPSESLTANLLFAGIEPVMLAEGDRFERPYKELFEM